MQRLWKNDVSVSVFGYVDKTHCHICFFKKIFWKACWFITLIRF